MKADNKMPRRGFIKEVAQQMLGGAIVGGGGGAGLTIALVDSTPTPQEIRQSNTMREAVKRGHFRKLDALVLNTVVGTGAGAVLGPVGVAAIKDHASNSARVAGQALENQSEAEKEMRRQLERRNRESGR